MNKTNSIILAFRFYNSQQTAFSLRMLLFITGIAGVLETLPILFSLPLIKSLFLGYNVVNIGSQELPLPYFAVLLGLILVLRFLVGRQAQFNNAKTRINLMSNFRQNQSKEFRKLHKVNFGKSVQSINFLLVGWSQLLPGTLFTLIGLYLSPGFGISALFLIIIWVLVLSRIKIKQDYWHSISSELTNRIDALSKEELKTLSNSKIRAVRWDATNKNLREIVIISSLMLALYLNMSLGRGSNFDSILSIVVLLRGLQQLYTAYIMSQQLSGCKKYLMASTAFGISAN
ncbi:MAG: hypothetical protein VXY91_07025 [Bacteroidota bacterium]|nr:hypothetical protein [Bacteroidota bacterium]